MRANVVIILIILTLFTSTSGLWYAIDIENSSDGFTPVAKIENDDYVTYANRGKSVDVDVEPLDLSSEEYIVTITVMTTATGDQSRGNYVASEPIPNAMVRLDGVPRYTDKHGKIKAYVYKQYVELYVNRSGYNPYIEIIDASIGEKVVCLKKPSDDVEIYSAMFDYQGKMFNLLNQTCYVLRGIDEAFCTLTVESNVEVERLMFYVNGELTKLSFGNEMYFTDEDFDLYSNDDKFTIKIIYCGIYSEYEEIFINFNDYNATDIKAEILQIVEQQSSEQLATANSFDNSNPVFIIGNEQSNVGNIGTLNPPVSLLEKILDVILPKEISYSHKLSEKVKFNVAIKFDFYKGTFEFLIGLKYKPAWVNKVNDKIKKYWEDRRSNKLNYEEESTKATMKESEQKYIECQKVADEAQANLEELKGKGYIGEEYFDAMRQMNDCESTMKDEQQKAMESGDYSAYNQAVENYKQSESNYQKVMEGIQSESEEDFKAIEKAEEQFKSAKTNANEALYQFLQDSEKYDRAFEELKDFFVNKNSGDWQTGRSFKIDLEIAFMGKVVYSYRRDCFEKATIFVDSEFKFKFAYQWVVTIPTPLPIPVPLFISIQGNVGLKGELQFVDSHNFIPFNKLLDYLSFYLLFGLRLDGGVGLAAKNITAGPYGKVDFTMQFIKDEKLSFQWGAGVKFQFLDFEVEYGYRSPEYTLWEGKDDKQKTAQIARLAKASAIGDRISDNQLFDRIYYASRPQLIQLADGRQMLIWIEDDENRDIYNSSVVKYSICEQGEWSAPKAICDDGRGDYAFDVYAKGDDVFVAMQKANRVMTEQDDLYSTLKSLDIFVAKYDGKTGKFGTANRITDDDKYDAAPQFAVVDDNSDVTLVWQSNTNDDFLGLTGENIIHSASYHSNAWSNGEDLFRNNKLISAYSCAVENGKTMLAVREAKDGDLFTFESNTIVIKDGARVYESDTAINPQFISLPSGIAMTYYKEGKLVATEDYLEEKAIVESIASQEYSISKSGETPAIFYEGYDGEVEKGYCALYINGEWTTQFSIIDEKIPEGDISALTGYYADGVVYSTYNFSLRDEEDSSKVTPIALCVAEHKRGYEIRIEALALDSIYQGKNTQIMLYVENLGDFDISQFEVDLCGQNILVECASPLKAGEGGYYFIDFVADIADDGCIEIVTTVYDGEKVLTSDTTSIFVRYTDMTIDAQAQVLNGKQQFKVHVSNISDVDSAISLAIYVNGELYKVEQAFVSAGDIQELIIEFDEINEGDYVYFSVMSQEKEFYTDDNGIGVTSIQTETLPQLPIYNAYQEYLNRAKGMAR